MTDVLAECEDSGDIQITNREYCEIAATPSKHEGAEFLRQLSLLCVKCQALVDNLPRNSKKCQFNHHKNWTTLKSSAENGCAMCSQFLDYFDRVGPWEEDSDEPTTGVVVQNPYAWFILCIFLLQRVIWILNTTNRL
jgi:hypothetical protein